MDEAVAQKRNLQVLFLQACQECRLEKALVRFQEIQAHFSCDLLLPASDSHLSDDDLRYIFKIVYAYANLNLQLNMRESAIDLFQKSIQWLEKLSQLIEDDWRSIMEIQNAQSIIYHTIEDYELFLGLVHHIIQTSKKIAAKTHQDVYLLIDVCQNAGNVCSRDAKTITKSKEWYKQADQYREKLLTIFCDELDEAKRCCDESESDEEWEAVLGHVDEVKSYFEDLCDLAPTMHDKKLREKFTDAIRKNLQRFVNILQRVCKAHEESHRWDQTQEVLSRIIEWYKKIEKLTADEKRKLKDYVNKLIKLKRLSAKMVPLQESNTVKTNGHAEKPAAQKAAVEENNEATKQKMAEEKAEKALKRQAAKARATLAEEVRRQEETKKAADEKKQKAFEQETAAKRNFFRKFDIEPLVILSRRLWNKIQKLEKKLINVEVGSAMEKATQSALAACTTFMNACDGIITDYPVVIAREYTVETLDELTQCNIRFRAAAKLVDNDHPLKVACREALVELHQLRKARLLSKSKKRAIKVRRFDVAQVFCSKSVLQTYEDLKPVEQCAKAVKYEFDSQSAATIYLFPSRHKSENGLGKSMGDFFYQVSKSTNAVAHTDDAESLVKYCEKLLLEFMWFQEFDRPRVSCVTEEQLGKVGEKLYKSCPKLKEISRNGHHPLCAFMIFLENCRIDPLGISDWEICHKEINELIPAGVEVASYIRRLCDLLLEEIASLNKSNSMQCVM